MSDIFGVKALAFFVVICEAAGAAVEVAEVEDAGPGDLETGGFEDELTIVEKDGSGRLSGINGAEVGEMGVGELGHLCRLHCNYILTLECPSVATLTTNYLSQGML